MASIKETKKYIEYAIDEVISDCLNVLHLYPGKKHEEVYNLVRELVDMRNNLIYRINHIENKDDPHAVKAHFKSIEKDLNYQIEKAVEKLSNIVKSNE
ncbi:MAG: hypothetical protein STSR0006_16920 [Lentimicrobium sp.]